MVRKKRKFVALILVAFIIGMLVGYFMPPVNFWGMHYYAKIPDFNKEEIAFIKEVSCVINQELENPSRYYINDLEHGNNQVVIKMKTLNTLQSGVSVFGYALATLGGDEPIFVFDTNATLIKKQ